MCQEKHGIENGWMECKPTGMGTEWVCMIMCNENTLEQNQNNKSCIIKQLFNFSLF